MHNSGVLPFADRSAGVWKLDVNFVKRYIDDTCDVSTKPLQVNVNFPFTTA